MLQQNQTREKIIQSYRERLTIYKHDIDTKLRNLGAVTYNMWLPETRVLPMVVRPEEQIIGVVFGRYHRREQPKVGRGAVVATDHRVLFIDKKPFFILCEELSYLVISGVSYSRAGLGGTVTLHARTGDIRIRTFNRQCAYNFVSAIERQIYAQPLPQANFQEHFARLNY